MKADRTSALIPERPSKAWRRLSTLAFLAGIVVTLVIVRRLPPAPPYAPALGRATYWQSYETSYFSSVRSYEQAVERVLASGLVPVVVFGDSTIRGSGATGDRVWTRVLEKRLQTANPRVRVLNFAQNAGDLMGPFLYHHLREKYPDAYYIMQWHFSSEVGIRHPFHYWLTSEIALRDGKRNPAVRRSFPLVPVTKPEERNAFVMAALNIATNYLDIGNWVRYRWLGRLEFAADRTVRVRPLESAPDTDIDRETFTAPPQPETVTTMRRLFLNNLLARQKYVHRPFAERAAYFGDMYPVSHRSHLLLLSLDLNPYYAPSDDPELKPVWADNWQRLRADMSRIPDLRWVSLTGADGAMQIDDFIDLGHLTVKGQRCVAETVAANLTGPGGWFDSATPRSVPQPIALPARWVETASLPQYQSERFIHLKPEPVLFLSSFEPALGPDSLSGHQTTTLHFVPPSGSHQLHTTLHIAPSAYENLSEGDATDGVLFDISFIGAGGGAPLSIPVAPIRFAFLLTEVMPHSTATTATRWNARSPREHATVTPETGHFSDR
jgi:hypothetical protein